MSNGHKIQRAKNRRAFVIDGHSVDGYSATTGILLRRVYDQRAFVDGQKPPGQNDDGHNVLDLDYTTKHDKFIIMYFWLNADVDTHNLWKEIVKMEQYSAIELCSCRS